MKEDNPNVMMGDKIGVIVWMARNDCIQLIL